MNISSTLNPTSQDFITASVNNASANQNVCEVYSSSLFVNVHNSNIKCRVGDSVPKLVNLNPNAKCFNPIPMGNIDSVEKCVPPVTYNVIDSSISFNETNLGTNRRVGNGDVYSVINKLRIENANRIIIVHLNINNIQNKIDTLLLIIFAPLIFSRL